MIRTVSCTSTRCLSFLLLAVVSACSASDDGDDPTDGGAARGDATSTAKIDAGAGSTNLVHDGGLDSAPSTSGAGDGGQTADSGSASPPVSCSGNSPDPKTAPSMLDTSCFTSTFDDEFLAYDISSGPTDDGMFPGEKWFNGTEQCCLAPSDNSFTGNYPTKAPDGTVVNPYSLLSGGGLQIRLQKHAGGWMSGVMTSVDENGAGFSQKYGYFEFDARMPAGTGTWPGLWMLPMPVGVKGGEIDVLEFYGGNPPQQTSQYTQFVTTFHDWTDDSSSKQKFITGLPDLTASFHRFGFLWNATYMAVYVDGALQWSVPTLAVAKVPYYLLADMGLGSGWDTSQTPSPSDLQIKSIKAFTVPGF